MPPLPARPPPHSPHGWLRSEQRAGRAGQRGARSPLTSGRGTRGVECRGALSPLSSSPAQRSALRSTPARPGLPLSQSGGTPPPLAAAAASASFSDSCRRRKLRRCDQRHLGSDGKGGRMSPRPARANHGPGPATGGGARAPETDCVRKWAGPGR